MSTEAAKRERAEKANDVRWHDVASLEDNVSTKDEPKDRTRTEVAERERANIPARDTHTGKFAPKPLEDTSATNGDPKDRTRTAVAFSVQVRRTEAAKRERAVKAVSSREWHPVDNPILSDNVTDKRSQPSENSLEDNAASKLSEPSERTRAADACLDVLDLYTVTELMTEVREGVRLGGGGVWHQVAAKVLRERLARRSGPTLAEQMAGKSTEHLRALVNLGRQLEHEERDLYRAARAELARRQGVRP